MSSNELLRIKHAEKAIVNMTFAALWKGIAALISPSHPITKRTHNNAVSRPQGASSTRKSRKVLNKTAHLRPDLKIAVDCSR